jgi:hypothetical protein
LVELRLSSKPGLIGGQKRVYLLGLLFGSSQKKNLPLGMTRDDGGKGVQNEVRRYLGVDMEIAKIKKLESGIFNGGWCYDTYPYLASLDAGKVIEIANIKWPAMIKSIFTIKYDISGLDRERTISMARGIVLLIYYNDEKEPAVEVPLVDFFCDGCNSKAGHFSSIFVEHTPEAYMAFSPIPFEKSCRVCLRNDTPFDTSNYSFVEYEELDRWDDSLW